MFEQMTENILITCYLTLMSSGILTNLFLVLFIFFNKKLKTSNNVLLINLFVSDLLLCSVCMPFTLRALIRKTWVFGETLCKVIPFVQAVFILVTTTTLSFISFDRMTKITSNSFIGKSWPLQ